MSLSDYATASNYLIAAATVVLALAALAYVAQWGFARTLAPEREVVSTSSTTGTVVELVETTESSERSDVAGGIGLSLTALAWLILLLGVVSRGIAAERVPWGNMYEF